MAAGVVVVLLPGEVTGETALLEVVEAGDLLWAGWGAEGVELGADSLPEDESTEFTGKVERKMSDKEGAINLLIPNYML